MNVQNILRTLVFTDSQRSIRTFTLYCVALFASVSMPLPRTASGAYVESMSINTISYLSLVCTAGSIVVAFLLADSRLAVCTWRWLVAVGMEFRND